MTVELMPTEGAAPLSYLTLRRNFDGEAVEPCRHVTSG
jgi:hypothetical protein